MNATGQIEELIGAGVTSFKIEGRLKDENYVRNVVGWYRRKLDGILARRDDLRRASEVSPPWNSSRTQRRAFPGGRPLISSGEYTAE
ncbi:MAG: U32 family peptidase [Alistipes indistinctus]